MNTEKIRDLSQQPMLDKYTTNLNEEVKAKSSEYEIYGRDNEIRDTVISLSRKTKNNPVLIGDPGVGKTAIVEGLALAIIRGEVPPYLQGITIRSLSLSNLQGKEDGGFLVKFNRIIEELKATKGKNLVFIDEFHTIVRAGSKNGEALDAGNMIKPAMSRGDIQLIGATTLDEYHRYIETDRALERRTQPIMIDEPSENEAIIILNQAKAPYETFHQVTIDETAVEQAVRLSVRYLPGLFLPDKAFDLIDEAATLAAYQGKDRVTEHLIAEVLKRRTGIAITSILKDEGARLHEIETILKDRVKGQDEAILAISDAIAINKAGLQDDRRPPSFLFLGTTGVGKTALSQALAFALFDDEEALIRIDMSEYSQKGSSLKLIGNRETREPGLLTERIKRRPYSVILVDEIEKGDQEVHDLFLQILDAGRLTDSTGRLINFKNCIVIMTTNVGAGKIRDKFEIKGPIHNLPQVEYNKFIQSMNTELYTEFRQEFINRIGDKIVFNTLGRDIILEITQGILDRFAEKMAKTNLSMTYGQDVLDYLADNGTDEKNGARPLEHLARRKVLAPISRKSLDLPPHQPGYRFRISVNGQAPKKTQGIDGKFHRLDARSLTFSVEKLG